MNIKKLQKITESLDSLIKVSKGELIDVGESPNANLNEKEKYYPTISIDTTDFPELEGVSVDDIVQGEYVAQVCGISKYKSDNSIRINLEIQKLSLT